MAAKEFKRSLVGVELEPAALSIAPGSERAVAAALRIAQADRAGAPGHAAPQGPARHRRRPRTDMEAKAELHVGAASAEKALQAAVQRLQPELLVMGTLSRAGIAGLIVGSTAERLLGHVNCSIHAIRPEGFVSPVR